MSSASAPAKINLALVVGPRRANGKHEVATVLQTVDLVDTLTLEPAPDLQVTGFPDDTLVTRALQELAAAAGVEARWHAAIDKHIPVAAGLAGGSSDAAAALRLANEALPEPLPAEQLSDLAAGLGADVPFFLAPGAQLGTADGTALEPLDLPLDYSVLLLLPHGAAKSSTADVYEEFDRRRGEEGFEGRRRDLLEALHAVDNARDLAALPPNDLASSPLAAELGRLGAFRSDVSGAGPALYGLFDDDSAATAAAEELRRLGTTRVCAPCRGTVDRR
jgi:4-diphosphocytidyl-2-C-methyl-D-erythritol kinase